MGASRLLASAFLVAVPFAARAQSDYWLAPERAGYRALVETYQAGRVGEAVTAVLELDPVRVERDHIDQVRERDRSAGRDDSAPDPSQRLFRAAAMLHTDAAERWWRQRRDGPAATQLELARRWADVTGVTPSPPGSFQRRWYLGAGLLLRDHEGWDAAADFVERACERLADDVPLLTTAGWLNEQLALAPVFPRGATLRDIRVEKRRQLTAAADWLRQALRTDPTATEARLRLSRISVLLDQRDEAEAHLTHLVGRTDVPRSQAYLVRLWLGRLLEDRADPTRAIALYEDALALLPRGQSAWMALAHLYLRTGNWRRAVESIEQPLLDDAATAPVDPWVEYLLGRGDGPLIRDQLRGEVRR